MHHKLLKGCIESLKLARLQLSNRVEPSITAELDSVILRLELCKEQKGLNVYLEPRLLLDTLEVLGKLFAGVEVVANLLGKFLK